MLDPSIKVIPVGHDHQWLLKRNDIRSMIEIDPKIHSKKVLTHFFTVTKSVISSDLPLEEIQFT